MIKNAKWIWLNKRAYPNVQKTTTWFSAEHKQYICRFAEIEKEFVFDKKIAKVVIEISADVKYFLYVNGQYVGVGPVTPGGDYNCPLSMPQQYYNTYERALDENRVHIRAIVQTVPIVQCDMTQGQNGFVCACKIVFTDGTSQWVYSDETWRCRLLSAATRGGEFDFTQKEDEWNSAEILSSVWDLYPSEIENTIEERILPKGKKTLIVKAGKTQTARYELDKIYSGYYAFEVQAEGLYELNIYDYEKNETQRERRIAIKGDNNLAFRSLVLSSAGGFDIEIKNCGQTDVKIENIVFLFQHYPCLSLGNFVCNDETLNKVYQMGKHALKICRQSIELDSPKHQENLQCAGDYHIASLMNYYADGDTRLTRFDIVRIARYLELSDGYMFHTTYGLIWVQMIYQYYMHSGDKDVISIVKPALEQLLNRHLKTVNRQGLIDKAQNYMFVDWIDVDGYSMHHPPKALGQTVLNAFYYAALQSAAKLYGAIGETDLQSVYNRHADEVKHAFECFFDKERGLYFDGLTDTDEETDWKPKNPQKRYYSWHSNMLAVLYDLAPKERQKFIVEKVLNDETLIAPQPYFMHFVLDGIYKADLFDAYGLSQLRRWNYMTEFGKGLVEGWFDCETYRYDYSHVWAGTPTYQLPHKLSGLKIIKAGFEEISLKPNLFGLEWANIRIPSPKGVIVINLKQGQTPCIRVPDGIKYTIEE